MEATRVMSRGAQRRTRNRLDTRRRNWSLSADEFRFMTLAEMLQRAGLPKRLTRGDGDHEDTTKALDGSVRELRRLLRAA